MGCIVTFQKEEDNSNDDAEVMFVHRTINTKALANVLAILAFSLNGNEELHFAFLRTLLMAIRSKVSDIIVLLADAIWLN